MKQRAYDLARVCFDYSWPLVFFVLLGFLSLYLSAAPGIVTPLWLSNIIGIYYLLQFSRQRWPFLLMMLSLANIFVFYVLAYSLYDMVAYTIVNIAEIAITAAALVYFQIPLYFDCKWKHAVILLIIAGLAAPLLRVCIASAWFSWELFSQTSLNWFAGDGIGMTSLLPIALCLHKGMLCELTMKRCFTLSIWGGVTAGVIIFGLMYMPDAYVLIVMPLVLLAVYDSIFSTLLLTGFSVFFIFTLYNAGWYVPLLQERYQYSHFIYFSTVFLFIIPYLIAVISRMLRSNKLEITHHKKHDYLTGLLNRREFEYQLEKVRQAVMRAHGEAVLGYIDLDNFKIINETAGHSAGDSLLQQIAIVLKKMIHQDDVIARIGGDKFGFIFSNCSGGTGSERAQKCLEKIKKLNFKWDKRLYPISACIGLVYINEEKAKSKQLLAEANFSCYYAKKEGRNRIILRHYKQEELSQQYDLANRLQAALQKEQFVLYFQPIIPLHVDPTLPLQSYEVLLRLYDDQQNIIPAYTFIETAERFNLMPQIDRWVIRQVLETYANQLLQLKHLYLSINLSAHSLSDPEFTHFLYAMLKKSPIKPQQVCFEITETAFMYNIESAVECLMELKRMGCKIALDDFGVGFSTFAYLKEFSVDYIKIDGGFVKNVAENHVDRIIVRNINEMAHALHIKTIAEYVENDVVKDYLTEIGVDFFQGFLYGTPKPLKDIVNDRTQG